MSTQGRIKVNKVGNQRNTTPTKAKKMNLIKQNN
jgi:hypothetical protein